MSSVSADTAARLRWHAGLGGALPDRGAICWAADPAVYDAEALGAAVDDVVAVLAKLNHELNGSTPSSSTGGGDPLIPSSTAYAVAEVIRMLGENAYLREAWRIETAWLAVLAGDIDDIEMHVAAEYRARGLDL